VQPGAAAGHLAENPPRTQDDAVAAWAGRTRWVGPSPGKGHAEPGAAGRALTFTAADGGSRMVTDVATLRY